MRTAKLVGFAASAVVCGGFAFAQDRDAAPPPTGPQDQVAANKIFAQGDVVRPAMDVETGPLDIRGLGVEVAFGFMWVTGAGAGGAGNQNIHQFDLVGNYIQSFPQTTASAFWGHRDLASDEANNKLYSGDENSQLHEYTWDGTNLTHTNSWDFGITGLTVRGLTRDPNTGLFWTKDFSSIFFKLDTSTTTFTTVPGTAALGTTYGLAWDDCNDTIWLWNQNNDGVNTTNNNQAREYDPSTNLPTGAVWYGDDLTPGVSHIAGGADIEHGLDNPGFLTFVGLHQSAPDSVVFYDLAVVDCGGPCNSNPVSYCTAGTTSGGCNATMSATGTASLSNAGPFTLTASNVDGNKNGILFYSIAGRNSAPWGNSQSVLCVKTPTQRMNPPTGSGGTNGQCDGSLTRDWNGFVAANPNKPINQALVVGQLVGAQAWFRDGGSTGPVGAKGTALSDAVEFSVCP